jgi:hypothetical protein
VTGHLANHSPKNNFVARRKRAGLERFCAGSTVCEGFSGFVRFGRVWNGFVRV